MHNKISHCLFLTLFFLTSLRAQPCTNKFWASADYLYFWMKDSPKTIPLVVTGPFVPLIPPNLSQPTTKILLGNEKIDNGGRSGVKVGVGTWVGPSKSIGFEGCYLFLSQEMAEKSVGSNGDPPLAVPYFNVITKSEASRRIAFLEVYTGKGILRVKNFMQDVELNGVFKAICSNQGWNLNLLCGFLWWNFNEKLTFSTDSPLVDNPSDVFNSKDLFRTHNNFFGGQLGLRSSYLWQKLSFLVSTQLALGGMISDLKIKGQFTTNEFNSFGTPQQYPAGYFAMTTNKGHYGRTHFALIPQVRAEIGYSIMKSLNLQLGYTFLYATKVMWASNQLDRRINPSQSPPLTITPSTSVNGKPFPKPLFKTNGFWAQGINVGLTLHY